MEKRNTSKSACNIQVLSPKLLENLEIALGRFLETFKQQIDLYFKNYNRLIREGKHKIDVMIKATKKERARHFEFLAREELTFWKDFPRKKKFYSDHLISLDRAVENDRAEHILRLSTTKQDAESAILRQFKTSGEVREIDPFVQILLNLLPMASRKFCTMFKIPQEKFCSKIASDRDPSIFSFEHLTQSLRMFDADDIKNWLILGQCVTILVSDTLAILLKEAGDFKLNQIQLRMDTTERLMNFAGYLSHPLPTGVNEEDGAVQLILDFFSNQIQFVWSHDIFGQVSKLSTSHFKECYKFLFRNLKYDPSDSSDSHTRSEEIFFARYLAIAPIDLDMGGQVFKLLEQFNDMLIAKTTSDEFRSELLMTLRYLVQKLCFYDTKKSVSYSKEAMQLLWDGKVQKIYSTCEQFTKKENLKEQAFLLMASILKIAPEDFLDLQLPRFYQSLQFTKFFTNKKTYLFELKLVLQLYKSGSTHFLKFRAWRPSTEMRAHLYVQNQADRILVPYVANHPNLGHIELSRSSIPNQPPLFTVSSIKDLFRLIFNAKLPSEVDFCHWIFLEQVAFDDLEYLQEQGLSFLLDARHQTGSNSLEMLNLGLKCAEYLLNPEKSFKSTYLAIHSDNPVKIKKFPSHMKAIRELLSEAVKEILLKGLHLKSSYVTKSMNFFSNTEGRSLCNDQTGAIWAQTDELQLLLQPASISQAVKEGGVGKFHLQDKSCQVTLEDLHEINRVDMKYQSNFLNTVVQDVNKTVNSDWDKKKETYIRHRISCFLAEQETLSLADQKEAGRQNTSFFNEKSRSHKQETKLVRLLLNLIAILPEVQELYKFFPTKLVMFRKKAVLENIIKPPFNFGQEEQKAEDDGYSKLRECAKLLPYLLLSLDFKIVRDTIRCLQRIFVLGTLSVRLALLDQLIYFTKELANDSLDDHLVPMIIQITTSLVGLWHQHEKLKIQSHRDVKSGQLLMGYEVIDFHSRPQSRDEETKQMLQELHSEKQVIFDLLDMVSLLAISNKEIFVRNLGCLLLVETGKLKRLIVHKDMRNTLADLLYFRGEQLKNSLVSKLVVLYSFKGQGFKSQAKLNQLLSEVTFFQFMTDNFEYQKFGLWESLVKDIQVLLVGDLASFWKQNIRKNSRVGGVILNFVQELASRTLDLYESKANVTGDLVPSNIQKDCVGFNLLMAIVLSNVTKSHLESNRQDEPDGADGQDQEIFSSGHLTSNTILDDVTALVSLTETNLNQVHKILFGKFYPARICTSNVLLSFLYYLQDPIDHKTFLNLKEIFILRSPPLDSSANDFNLNCLLFYTLLIQDTNSKKQCGQKELPSSITSQASKQTMLEQKTDPSTVFSQYVLSQVQLVETDLGRKYSQSQHLVDMIKILNIVNSVEIEDDALGNKKTILKISLSHSICNCLHDLRSSTQNEVSSTDYLSQKEQLSLLAETKSQFSQILASVDLSFLAPKIQDIWFCLLSFEVITDQSSKANLDLKFLIKLEQEGYTNAIQFYRFFNKGAQGKNSASNESIRVNEIKLLIQHVYAFYGCSNNEPAAMLMDEPRIDDAVQKNRSRANTSESGISTDSRLRKPQARLTGNNVFFECLALHLIDTRLLLQALSECKDDFSQVYAILVCSIFRQPNQSVTQQAAQLNSTSIQARVKHFLSHNIHSKLFLVGLFISLNAVDQKLIQSACILSLSVLPLMFNDNTYRSQVERNLLAWVPSQIAKFEQKNFYQFVKRVFREEETFNMQNHFEKYFSLSGFLRDLLNEVIKLLSVEAGLPTIAPQMLLKVLDIITYFFSGNLDLRRAPKAPNQDEDNFVFAHLIDYKSFEFLSKLYKVSEKLVDADGEMLVMNMWYKVVENRPHNFEILAKFLIHNLSSFIMKLQSGKEGTSQDKEYGIEFEKQKRFSLSIFNYIKARTMQIDVRNSLNVTGPTWSQKMLRVVMRAQLNINSKYTLEKLKLKKVLQTLHAEINQSGLRIQLKGGLEQLTEVMQIGKAPVNLDVRGSVSMSQLLQSRTFLDTFGKKEASQKLTLKQIMFIVTRQMAERFDELTPESQISQMPDMVLKYFENTLMLIANESERLQLIRYSAKEEIVLSVLILVLLSDLAISNQAEQPNESRIYFLYDLLNKLALNANGVQKYIRLQSVTFDQFKNVSSVADILAILNTKNTFDSFTFFTKSYFKVLQNLNNIPTLHTFMLHLWKEVANLHMGTIQKAGPENQRLLYSRRQILVMLQSAVYVVHQASMRSCRVSSRYRSSHPDTLTALIENFLEQIQVLLDYIFPSQFKGPTLKDTDKNSVEIKMVSFVGFWLAHICLETAAILSEDQSEASLASNQTATQYDFKEYCFRLQEVGAAAMRRRMEESDFLKQLVMLQKLDKNFYSYSIMHESKKTPLLQILFAAYENVHCFEEVSRILIQTIKVQDFSLLSCAKNDTDLGKDEFQRLILILPFFIQQFLDPQKSSAVIFSNKRNIVALLKKALPSIGIATKKEILSILDVVQRECDHDDRAFLKEQFELLLDASVSACAATALWGVLQECLRTLKVVQEHEDKLVSDIFGKLKTLIEGQLKKEGIQECHPESRFQEAQNFFSGHLPFTELLGEEVCRIKKELRPIYFGLKHLVLMEIEHLDTQIEFFDSEENPLEKQISSSLVSRKSTVSEPSLQLRTRNSFSSQNPPSNSNPAKLGDGLERRPSKNYTANAGAGLSIGSDNAYSASLAQNQTGKKLLNQIESFTLVNEDDEPFQLASEKQPSQFMVHSVQSDLAKAKGQGRPLASQILFEKAESDDDAFPKKYKSHQSFAESVIKEGYKDHVEDSNEELEGLIGTFSRPAKEHHTVHEKRLPALATEKPKFKVIQKIKPVTNYLIKGEVPVPDQLFKDQTALSSISVRREVPPGHLATVKGFVAERAEQIFTESDDSSKFNFQEDQNRPNTGFFSEAGKFDFKSDRRVEKPHFQTGKLQSSPLAMDTYQVPQSEAKKNPNMVPHHLKKPMVNKFYASEVGEKEDLPTHKKSQFDSLLLELVSDEDRFYNFETFLQDEKNYDCDNLAFYVKVLEYKKETDPSDMALAAGLIIDNYLTEEAEYYIGSNITSSSVISRLIGTYEFALNRELTVPMSLFDEVTTSIGHELARLLREFNEQS